MQDINQRKELELLVSEFYRKVLADEKIASVYTGIVEIIWLPNSPDI